MNPGFFKTVFFILSAPLLSGCQTVPSNLQAQQTQPSSKASSSTDIPVIISSAMNTVDNIVPALVKKRVVFIGESHDQYHHHLAQLALIEKLYALNPDLAIGLEFFQRPFQQYLDAYINDEINEQTMLEKTEYFKRWGYDYRLYQPILNFAQKNKIPLIALNLPEELTKKVGREGLEILTDEEKKQLPSSIDRNVSGYKKRLEEIFNQHAEMSEDRIDNFINVQLLWDEGMAETAADYLLSHSDKNMVILAGSGHINFRSGIPIRLERRIKTSTATVVPADQSQISNEVADYLLFPKPQLLEKNGLIGVSLSPSDQGMKVESISSRSKAKDAGVKKNDQIISIEQKKISGMPDIRLQLWNKKPGDTIELAVLRKNADDKNETLEFKIELIQPKPTAH